MFDENDVQESLYLQAKVTKFDKVTKILSDKVAMSWELDRSKLMTQKIIFSSRFVIK